jgi:pimeloyl-ACP methyl ester carboxylesterase
MTNLAPSSSGFVTVNGFELWHEIYGSGEPIIVLHGGLMTIPEMSPLIEPLAKRRKVIGVELQGHGHSADTDRPLRFDTCADDVAALIDALELKRTDIAGLSFGGDIALRTAIRYPSKIRRLVVWSAGFARSGWYPEAQAGMNAVDHSLASSLIEHTPTGKLSRAWREPDRFPKFLDKLGKLLGEPFDLSAEVKQLPMPVLLVYADHDSVTQRHIADFFALLGGGISEPGWQDTKFTRARLAIIPGYSHYDIAKAPEVGPIIEKFLEDPRLDAAQRA